MRSENSNVLFDQLIWVAGEYGMGCSNTLLLHKHSYTE